MKETALDYAEFAAYDRRQRGIERHVVAAFVGGVAVGLIGILAAGRVPQWLGQLYDPYMYLALALVVGASAAGFGWALLATFLAALSMIVAATGGSLLRGQTDLGAVADGPAAGLNWALVLLVGVGLLAYVTSRTDIWGDVAAGVVGALLLADTVDRATPGFINSEPAFWPGPAIAIGVLSVVLVLALRRSMAGRVRALALAAVLTALFAVGVTGALAGWISIAG
ncbi:hypothetical protein [Nonomuraea sp. NEAU-A123]|uniref:hypothetical protein n=1 Tax=Nonomuraea sp. NEAU-A123 TaxID=2839649 RepID=UPI001BE4C6DD|nr:hypothetical protein [Nonomuraea sp. NEAU-A123]MBT2234082.1 hypothetical protein [Nonomuraea sp. NEAU-A123]